MTMANLPVLDVYWYKGVFAVQVYIESILALQQKACEDQGKPVELDLVIMTSDDTHSRTQDLIDDHGSFGMQRQQLHLLKQEKVNSLCIAYALPLYGYALHVVRTCAGCLCNAQCTCESRTCMLMYVGTWDQ